MIAQAGAPSQIHHGITGDPGFRKGDEARALGAGLVDQPDRLVDGRVEIEKGGCGLHRGDFEFWMGSTP